MYVKIPASHGFCQKIINEILKMKLLWVTREAGKAEVSQWPPGSSVLGAIHFSHRHTTLAYAGYFGLLCCIAGSRVHTRGISSHCMDSDPAIPQGPSVSQGSVTTALPRAGLHIPPLKIAIPIFVAGSKGWLASHGKARQRSKRLYWTYIA